MIDLHLHSTASDGSDTPAELVGRAHALGLEAMALTDHDTCAGLEEAEESAANLGIDFIRGCEVSSLTEQGEMHVLGLFLPRNCQLLEDFLAAMRQRRKDRNLLIIEKLRSLGIAISLDEVLDRAKGTVGRPHIAAVLVEKGHARDYAHAFMLYLGRKGKAYVPKPVPPVMETVKVLRNVGATVALAHPLLRVLPPKWLDNLVTSLKPHGLVALEAWHSAHDAEKTAQLIDLADRHGLLLTGGSDYHGCSKPEIQIGSGKGNLHVSLEVLEKLRIWRRKNGLPC